MVTFFKQNRWMIDENSIQNWVNAHLVLSNIRLNSVTKIVVNWVFHVVRFKVIFKSFLVDLVIFKHLTHYVQTSLTFICIQTNFKHPIAICLTAFTLVKLILQNKVKNFLDQTQTWVKNYVTEFFTTENSFFHLI